MKDEEAPGLQLIIDAVWLHITNAESALKGFLLNVVRIAWVPTGWWRDKLRLKGIFSAPEASLAVCF